MRQETICAKVNARLLSKADRLFTGSTEDRVIEILQNARRAGASEVKISNRNGFVTVEDNGTGIEDFAKLLDLGGSGWDDKLEAGEDPAGVGLFCLAPREVTIISKGRKIVIDKDGWTGKPVTIGKTQKDVNGTFIKFKDEKPWDMELVEQHAVFAGTRVIVDGKYCHSMPFCSKAATFYKNPGCRIETVDEISKYHRQWTDSWYHGRILVNFHGQVIELDYWPSKNRHDITILVDIADRTDIRLMLPARTRLVENKAFEQLKAVIELEYYRYFQRQKTHSLYYDDFLRAKELGIQLPEAQANFRIGLLESQYGEHIEISQPQDFKLEYGYLCQECDCEGDLAETNAHLLAALGTFDNKPFVPVEISVGYMGYSWAKLPTVTKVEVAKDKELLRQYINCNEIACFDRLSIAVYTSDGKIFRSDVAMAIVQEPPRNGSRYSNEVVCVTQAARNISSENILFHLGGYRDEGDCLETQLEYFEKELDGFWDDLIGPYESLRSGLLSAIGRYCNMYDKWRRITVVDEGSIEILFKNGKKELINQPAKSV